MPSTSSKQHRLMAAVAHNPSFAKKVGIPQSVGRDFTEADKGRKFAKGGDMKNAAMKKIFAGKETPAEERKEKAAVKKASMSYKAAEKKFEGEKYAKGGFTSCADGVATKGRTKAQKFAMGGMPMVGRAGPNRMVAPSMTPAGGAGLSQLIKDLGGGRLATPEEKAKMDRTLSSLGMSRPQFNPADADKLRAEMQSRMAAQGMRPIGMGLDQRAIAANPAGFSRMMQGAQAQEKARPGSTMLSQAPASMAPKRPMMGASAGPMGLKSGGSVKTFAKGGKIDGCATKGKTKGRYI